MLIFFSEHETCHKNDACTPKSIESCRGERFQHPAEGSLKPVLNIHRFTRHHESPYSDRAQTRSILSSDTPEDLQLHSEDSRVQPKNQENMKTSLVPSSVTPETKALNVKNNQRSKNMLLINNNREISDRKSLSYFKCDCEFERNATVDTPLVENLLLKANADTGKTENSLCCDGIDEPISIHSEALACSEEEKDRLKVKKHIEIPEASQFELEFNDKDGEGRATAETLLSEILSPVDEVLSYGSAELPPSIRGLDSYSCPPHPAFEIITWTSDEELQVPADVLEDLSVNSEHLPPLPADVTLRRKESQSLSDDANGDLCKTFTSSTGEDDENDCSECTSSFPDDVKNEISDPLSSFQIGDRVLVCNSRAGVLRYKGPAAFADGFWAGVALDNPNGNHNGTFRGVKYFGCDKSHGVLVRAEDVSHVRREHGSDVETGVDEDLFSDEELYSTQQKGTSSSAGGQEEQTRRPKELQDVITDAAIYLSCSPLVSYPYFAISMTLNNILSCLSYSRMEILPRGICCFTAQDIGVLSCVSFI